MHYIINNQKIAIKSKYSFVPSKGIELQITVALQPYSNQSKERSHGKNAFK